ncbi:MAG: MBL fold metallo-hydrolase [Nanoarchaeota archaeon]|nr:MBL fold metallo-hydrolase [Nanoarchaeota archaeon]
MLTLHTIGGYNEVGKNMTVLEVGEDAIIFDLGLYLPSIVGVQEREKVPTEKGMRALGALPDDLYLDKKGLRNKVRAILISHAHLDHVGAVQYLAQRYKAPVLGTPFTIEVLKKLMEDNRNGIPNKIIKINPNGSYIAKGKNNYKVEFINITHSTIQCALIAVHTKDGIILYANDYKMDNTPVMGDPPNYKRLKELSKIGIKALISNCLYAPADRKTPSEKIARDLLEEVLFTIDSQESGLIVTTFSSHIARIKSIIEFGRRLNREVVLLGRSMNKYVTAAVSVGKAPFKNKVQIATYRNQLEKVLKKANKNKKNYMIICTGHQGEPGSILDRLSRNKLPYKISSQDNIIFSSMTIPTAINETMRADLDRRLKKFHPRIFDKVHVSGHGGKEDIRELIKLTNPEHFIPSHGDFPKLQAGMDLAMEMGYKKNYNTHLLSNGKMIRLK